MDKLRIYEQGSQVSIMAVEKETASVFDDREDAQAFPAFDVGQREAQLALFILR